MLDIIIIIINIIISSSSVVLDTVLELWLPGEIICR